jgi:hypothetical protein
MRRERSATPAVWQGSEYYRPARVRIPFQRATRGRDQSEPVRLPHGLEDAARSRALIPFARNSIEQPTQSCGLVRALVLGRRRPELRDMGFG